METSAQQNIMRKFMSHLRNYKPKANVLIVNKTAIRSGDMLEVWEYQSPMVIRLDKKSKIGRKVPDEFRLTKEELQDKRMKNCWQSYHDFCRLVVTNFGNYSKFLTLTFSDKLAKKKNIDVRSVSDCNNEFRLFMDRLRDRYGKDFKYIATIEFQETHKRGAVHYHVVLNTPYIPQEKIREAWGLGSVDIREIKEAERVMIYIGSYMRKGLLDERLIGQKKYWGSKNLVRPDKFYNENVDELLSVAQKKESQRKTYFSDYHNCGITYTKYYFQKQYKS